MTVPITVSERPSVSGAGRESGVKKASAAYPVKSKFDQKLACAAKKQNPLEVNQKNKSIRKTSAVESRKQVAATGKESQAKDARSPDLMPQEPEVGENIPANQTEIEASMNCPIFIDPAVTAQNDTNAAEGSKALDQVAESPKGGDISLIPEGTSEQSDDKADPAMQTDAGKAKTLELFDKPELELKPNKDGVADNSKKADKQESTQVLITKMPHEYAIKKNTMQGREPEADKTSTISSPVVEKTENLPTDVKKIMAMENHIRPGKVVMAEADGEKAGQNNSQSDQGQDSPKFNLLPHQADNLQVRTASSEMLESPMKEQVDPKDLIQQIVKKAEVLLKSDISEIKMQLKPEFLGKMLIKVTVEEGTVVTKIITENQHVKQVLEANLNSLRQNLEANGMKVEKTEVSVQLFNNSGGNYDESGSNRYPSWSEQQGQNRRSYAGNNYGLPEMENLPDLPGETGKYGIGSEGQVNYLI